MREEEPENPTFKDIGTPTYGICNESLPDVQVDKFTRSNVVAAFSILGEDVLKILRNKPSFCIVGAGIAAMFVLVDSLNEHTEEGVRYPARNGRIREVGMYDDNSK